MARIKNTTNPTEPSTPKQKKAWTKKNRKREKHYASYVWTKAEYLKIAVRREEVDEAYREEFDYVGIEVSEVTNV